MYTYILSSSLSISHQIRLRSKELTQQLERSRKQILELEERLSKKNSDFDALREQIHNRSESRLQAELSLIQLEKVCTCTCTFMQCTCAYTSMTRFSGGGELLCGLMS